MKLSIAWIFDHIDADWRDQNIDTLISKFNQTTTEIEGFQHFTFNLDNYYLAQLPTQQSTKAFIPELNKEVAIKPRANTYDLLPSSATNITFMVKKNKDAFVWASLADFGVEKDGLIPALDATEEDLKGTWREKFENKDIIIEVDNKSITHRPDMWGHRGFAREIAAFLNLPFKPKEDMLVSQKQLFFDNASQPTKTCPFVIENKAPDICNVFNGLYFSSIENKPSNIFITSRLLKVEARPITGIVDLTNYVTLDWSQPVHAYDAEKVTDKKIVIRMAQDKETLLLLDDAKLELAPEDLLIADAKKGLCLAGVKGGFEDSVGPNTTSIFFESANFDAAAVRRAAFRHKTRSDSSARFEKTLDPNQAVEAIQRFLKLTQQCNIATKTANEIITVGKKVEPLTIEVSHEFLESHSGCTLSRDEVTQSLSRIEFDVTLVSKDPLTYGITIPTFRSSKDIKIKEDILEEVVRLHGFENVNLELPARTIEPSSLMPMMRSRTIKHFFAFSAHMVEQQNYAMCDEQYIQELGITVNEAVEILNPVSENYRRLITSLIPALLKNIKENIANRDSLRFFESARIWVKENNENNEPSEKKNVAGIFFEKRKHVDFYECKQHLLELFKELGFASGAFSWKQVAQPHETWYMPYQSANIMYDNKKIGSVGKINPTLLAKIDALPESDAFIFELDGDFLQHTHTPKKVFKEFSRFQDNYFDVSLLVPLTLTTSTLSATLQEISPLVQSVKLIDFFEKADWDDIRSLTFRVWVSDIEKTLERDEIEEIRLAAIKAVETCGAELRS